MATKTEFHHESMVDTQSVVKYLEALKEGFSKGGLKFGSEDRQVVLNPKGLLRLKISVDRKDNRIKFNMKVEWKEGKESRSPKQPLVIKPSAD